jgi:putative nucleotidyltransferase with HDIG domain
MKVKITPSEIKSLAPVSVTISRLTYLMHDLNAKTADIVRLIELDAALTINVLRWANSAYFRSAVRVESIRTAVVRMGMNNIIRLSIGGCLASTLRKSVPGYELAENDLWRHNMTAALTVEVVSQIIKTPTHPAAFTAAMLHDIGKSILGQHLDREQFRQLRELMATEKLSAVEAERRLFETDHAEVGAAMASYWKFPDELAHAIEQHHNLDTEGNGLLELVIIADAIANKIDHCRETEPVTGRVAEIMRRQGLQPEAPASLCEIVKNRLAKTEEEWVMEEEEKA